MPVSRNGLTTRIRAASEMVTRVSPRSPDQNSLMCICRIATRDGGCSVVMRNSSGALLATVRTQRKDRRREMNCQSDEDKRREREILGVATAEVAKTIPLRHTP